MSVSHFWYKLTTKAGNLFLNLKEKAEKKNAYIWNNPWIFFFFLSIHYYQWSEENSKVSASEIITLPLSHGQAVNRAL